MTCPKCRLDLHELCRRGQYMLLACWTCHYATFQEIPVSRGETLPLALRNDELTEQEFDALYRNVADPNPTSGRLKRVPCGIPVGRGDVEK